MMVSAYFHLLSVVGRMLYPVNLKTISLNDKRYEFYEFGWPGRTRTQDQQSQVTVHNWLHHGHREQLAGE